MTEKHNVKIIQNWIDRYWNYIRKKSYLLTFNDCVRKTVMRNKKNLFNFYHNFRKNYFCVIYNTIERNNENCTDMQNKIYVHT